MMAIIAKVDNLSILAESGVALMQQNSHQGRKISCLCLGVSVSFATFPVKPVDESEAFRDTT